ncbi:MAG: hypothetical protein ACFFBD_01855 [Candidatus Hodarchaeota archaeon]
MAFIRDLFKRDWFFRKTPKAKELSRDVDDQDFLSLEDLDDEFRLAICLSSFCDTGMEIRAQGPTCQTLFSAFYLEFIANFTAVFFEQSTGEHLFGPLPPPQVGAGAFLNTEQDSSADLFKDQNTALEDWYLMVYVFTATDANITDFRIADYGRQTAGMFLIFYPRRFDHLIMQSKTAVIKILSSTSGVSTDISTFSDNLLSVLEQRLRAQVLSQYQVESEPQNNIPNFALIRMGLEYQLTTINERLTTLISLSQRLVESSNSSNMESFSAQQIFICFVYSIPDIVTLLHWTVLRGKFNSPSLKLLA